MKPENVKPKNFELIEIVYDNEEFSIAYGSYRGGEKCIAMRWNGRDEEDPGYPKTFKNPMWMIINDSLKIPFLKAVFAEKYSKSDTILKILTGEL
jgi:hypothetical protein